MSREADLDRLAWRFWRGVSARVCAGRDVGYSVLASSTCLTHAAQAGVRTMPVPAAACVAIEFRDRLVGLGPVRPLVLPTASDWWRITLDRTIGGEFRLGGGTVCGIPDLPSMLSVPEPWSRQAMGPSGRARVPARGRGRRAGVGPCGPSSRRRRDPSDRVQRRIHRRGCRGDLRPLRQRRRRAGPSGGDAADSGPGHTRRRSSMARASEQARGRPPPQHAAAIPRGRCG